MCSSDLIRQKEYQQLQKAVENGIKRIAEIDRLIEKVFEQNAEQRIVDLRLVLRTLREMTDIKSLAPTLVN